MLAVPVVLAIVALLTVEAVEAGFVDRLVATAAVPDMAEPAPPQPTNAPQARVPKLKHQQPSSQAQLTRPLSRGPPPATLMLGWRIGA